MGLVHTEHLNANILKNRVLSVILSVILSIILRDNDSLGVALGAVQRVLIICAEGFVQKAFITVLTQLSIINLDDKMYVC